MAGQPATDTPPNTPADTAPPGAVAAATGVAGAPTAPGGSISYNPAISSGNVLSNLTTPGGTMPTTMPSDLEQANFQDLIAGTPAVPAGYGKGRKAPDLTRLSDLVKLVAAIGQGTSLDNVGPNFVTVIQDLAKQAKIGQGKNDITFLNDPKVRQQISTTAWKDIVTHLDRLGVAVPADLRTPPNGVNAVNKLKALGDVRLEHPTVDALQRNGFDVSGMRDVSSLVSGHDSTQFGAGAPGTQTGSPATPSRPAQVTGAHLWDDFSTKWNENPKVNGTSFQDSVVQSLVGIGALDLTSGNPTTQDVATAYQNVMRQASKDGVSVQQEFQKLSGELPTGPLGQPITGENVNQAYILHVADQILGPGGITPYQATTLANLANKVGTGTAAADDLINQGIVSLLPQAMDKVAQNPTSPNFAAVAYQNANDTLARWGIQATPGVLQKIVTGVLQTGVNTPYQLNTLASQAAEAYAKQNVGNLYGQGVASLASTGQDVATTASPYLQTASTLLGTPVTDMQITDPTGKWMKWSEGGSGPGGMMTQSEWSKHLMTDPSYNFDTSQTAKNTSAEGAAGLLQLLGKLPDQSNPFSSGASLATATGAAGS